MTTYDEGGSVIETIRTALGSYPQKFLRILIPFVFSACTADVYLEEQNATIQMYEDSSFENGLSSWTQNNIPFGRSLERWNRKR